MQVQTPVPEGGEFCVFGSLTYTSVSPAGPAPAFAIQKYILNALRDSSAAILESANDPPRYIPPLRMTSHVSPASKTASFSLFYPKLIKDVLEVLPPITTLTHVKVFDTTAATIQSAANDTDLVTSMITAANTYFGDDVVHIQSLVFSNFQLANVGACGASLPCVVVALP